MRSNQYIKTFSRKTFINACVFTVFCLFISCDKKPASAPVTPRENRQFGFHITTTETTDYDENLQLAKQAGMEILPITFIWNHIEKKQNSFDATIPDLANLYYPANNISLCLSISPMYAIHKAVPDDIKNLAWNDPIMINRFKNFLTYLKQKMPAVKISFLSIGNEVDLLLQNDADWQAYKQFYEAARQHAKTLWGNNLLVGVEATWTALATSFPSELKMLNQNSDYIQVSYYPLENDFTMKPPQSFITDMDKILAAYPNRKIVLEETGYATSTVCNSSDEKQKEYIKNIFKWWDKNTLTVPYIGFLWLNDLSVAEANQYATDYGLPGNNTFKEYLRTPALRTWNGKGKDKSGFIQLKNEAYTRGW